MPSDWAIGLMRCDESRFIKEAYFESGGGKEGGKKKSAKE
jgi:hypothetical protein